MEESQVVTDLEIVKSEVKKWCGKGRDFDDFFDVAQEGYVRLLPSLPTDPLERIKLIRQTAFNLCAALNRDQKRERKAHTRYCNLPESARVPEDDGTTHSHTFKKLTLSGINRRLHGGAA